MAAASPADCVDMAFEAARIAVEHTTPVILLTDAFIANGSTAWRIPEASEYPEIRPHYVTAEMKDAGWRPYMRDEKTKVRYIAVPGTEGFTHRLGGLEKDCNTSAISTDPANHAKMVALRAEKIANIANDIPQLEVFGDKDADTLVIGWGGTFGHLYTAVSEMSAAGKKVALAHFRYIRPLPANTAEVLSHYKKVVVAELNTGQFADYLQAKHPGINIRRINKVEGQPFSVNEIVEGVTKIMEEK